MASGSPVTHVADVQLHAEPLLADLETQKNAVRPASPTVYGQLQERAVVGGAPSRGLMMTFIESG